MSAWKARLEKKQQDQKDEERRKQLEVNEISFPSLSTESTWGTAGSGKVNEAPKKSFASLASEWKDAEDERLQKEKEEADRIKRQKQEREESSVLYKSYRYNFGDSHSRVEDTYYEEELEEDIYVDPKKTEADESNDWRVQERKPRRAPLSSFEKIMREEARQQQELQEPQFFSDYDQDDTVWKY
jgi:hypothetical protein